jgi:hypothetical protein
MQLRALSFRINVRISFLFLSFHRIPFLAPNHDRIVRRYPGTRTCS